MMAAAATLLPSGDPAHYFGCGKETAMRICHFGYRHHFFHTGAR
jgi:hypothetical protein